MSAAVRVNLARRCCPGPAAKYDGRRARWEIYVVLPGTPDTWPTFQWPASRKHTIPTPDERARALASLGYRLAPGAQWEWDETTTPNYHDHPVTVSMLAGTSVVPAGDGA